uniref:Mitochondrial import inner membrane translocase subunit TIM22 n=1 Tax=Ditylum brightwellii TaxID=49249 RepID=A0A7S2E5G4_9STRA
MGGGGEGLKNVWGKPNDRYHTVEGPCVDRIFNASVVGAAAGTFYGSLAAAWYPDAITSDKRFGGFEGRTDVRALTRMITRPAFLFSAAAAAFAGTECLAESARGKKDSFNSAIGGFAAGCVIGATTKRFDIMTSTGIGLGIFLFSLDYSGAATENKPLELHHKMYGMLPEKHVESDELRELKEKYPKFEHL